MMGNKDFKYFGDALKIRHSIEHSPGTIQRIELGRVLLQRYQEIESQREEIVPNLVPNSSFGMFVDNQVNWGDLLFYLRELSIWDIVSGAKGPKGRWPLWWI
jgi:hypothetical protein